MNTGQPPRAVEYWKQQAESFDAIYSGAKSTLGRSLDRWLRKDIFDRFDWVMRQAGDLSGKTVCDLGCGSGRYLVPFAQAGAARVVGLDSAPGMIEKAEQLIREAGVGDRVQARVANVIEAPLDGSFDVAIAVGLFDYVRDPGPLLSRVRTLTRGKFLSTWPAVWTWRMPVRQMRLTLLGCPVYFFTKGQVARLHQKAGFELRKIERVGEIYCTLAEPR